MPRTKVVLALATGGLALAVGVPSAVSAATGPSSSVGAAQAAPGNGNGNNGSNGASGNGGFNCGYPSNRTPVVAMTATPTTVKPGQSTTLKGSGNSNKCPMQRGKSLTLYSASKAAGPFTKVSTVTTDGDGAFSATQAPRTTTFYKAVFAGDASTDAASSPVVQVTVK